MSRPRYVADHSADQRDCALYRIQVLDPRTNYTTVCLGYIGETAREPFIRFMEHLYEQPFGDTIVGKPEVDPRVFRGKDAVLAAEKAAVEAERPLYNCEWNLGNPDRIPIPVARRQREARDRARGRVSPVWRPARDARPGRATAAVGWSPRRKLATRLAAAWLVLAVAAGLGALHFGAAPVPALADGAGSGVALLVAGWLCKPVRGVRRTRARRKCAAALVAVAALAVVWTVAPAEAKRPPALPAVGSR